jgi:hypothetical protein
MTQQDKETFEKMMVIFVGGMAQYPTDMERLKAGYEHFYRFINSLVERECSKVLSAGAQLRDRGGNKGFIN